MQRLGDDINPALMLQDYSPFVSAAAIRSAGLLNMGNQITGAMKDAKEEKKRLDSEAKVGADAIKAAGVLFPEMKPKLDQIGSQLDNPDKTPRERAAFASEIRGLIDMGVRSGQQDRAYGLQDRQLANTERATAADILNATANTARTQRVDAEAIKALAMDATTKSAVGPGLLDYLKKTAPAPLVSGIDPAQYSPEESYNVGNAIMGIIPKKERAAAPAITEIAVPGGTMKMQWSEEDAKFVPIQTGGIYTAQGEVQPGELPPPDGMVLPPKDGAPDVVMPGGVVVPGFTPTPPPSPQEQIAAANFNATAAEKAATKKTAAAANQRVLKTIDKYMTPDGKPTAALSDAVGAGEDAGSFLGRFTNGTVGNTAQTRANQKELQLDLLEQDLLNAAKDLKPVSEDEMKQLMSRRPELTDPPETWTWFMKRVKSIIAADANAPGPATSQAPVSRAATGLELLQSLPTGN